MRILLDESVPRRLGYGFAPHFVRSVQTMGWAGLKNSALHERALTLVSDQLRAPSVMARAQAAA